MPLGMRSTFFDRAPYYLLPHRTPRLACPAEM
jgi:hypothetical protein